MIKIVDSESLLAVNVQLHLPFIKALCALGLAFGELTLVEVGKLSSLETEIDA